MAAERNRVVFSQIPQGAFLARLGRELADAARELARGPLAYLKVAFLPDRFASWFPSRLAREVAGSVAGFVAHPLAFIRGLFSFDKVSARVLVLFSGLLVTSFILYEVLVYSALLSPFSSFQIVSRSYRDYKEPVMLTPLRYPPQMLRGPESAEKAMTLEEIRDREQERREKAERERLAKERIEKERVEKEKARKEREAELAKAVEDKDAAKAEPASGDGSPGEIKFGEINEAPIRDIVSRTYARYKEGKLDIPTMDFTVMAGFEIEKDGSLSKVRLIQPSSSEVIILHAISESHALSPIAHLTSNTIRFDLDSKSARLTITGFAPSAREASNQAGALNLLLYAARITQQSKSPETAELLSLVKVKSDNNRIDAEMMVSRARASEMMRARFSR
jgi:hypothetical protein